jgi:choline-sulfatase
MKRETHRPNILFLMTDQHRADVCGYAGNRVVRTPTLDRLAATGTVFANAYTPSPVCIPARQCLMAGQLPKTCNCQGWIDLAPGYRTWAREFSRHAYHTVCCGKLHHIGPDQMQGWRERLAPDAEIRNQYVTRDGDEAEYARYPPSPGTERWPLQREIEEAGPINGQIQMLDRHAYEASLDLIDRYFAPPGHIHWQYRHAAADRPLLLKLSFVQPHYPFFAEPERFAYYLDRVPLYMEERCAHPILGTNPFGTVNAKEEAVRRATAAYYAMVDRVDDYFGRVLERLESVGEDLDDWIIVFTADHGEMLGQHGLWEKQRFYEGSVRVPLIIRWPRHFSGGRVVDANVSLCDLFATLCDLAGIRIPGGLDSRSLAPLMAGKTDSWSNEAISQLNRDQLMIKQDNLKYQYYGEGVPEVLFDLAQDPGEERNVASAPEYASAMQHFRQRRAALGHGPRANPNYENAGY